MLEILFLIWFCKKLSAMAREKNRPGSWGALGAVLWISGEVGGFLLAITGGAEEMAIYGYALLGALLGAVLAYVIVATRRPIPRDGDLPVARVL